MAAGRWDFWAWLVLAGAGCGGRALTESGESSQIPPSRADAPARPKPSGSIAPGMLQPTEPPRAPTGSEPGGAGGGAPSSGAGAAGSGQAGVPANIAGSSFVGDGGAAGVAGGAGEPAEVDSDDCSLPPLLPGESPELGGIRSIESGYLHTCALRADGFGATCWGSGASGQLGDGHAANSSIPVLVSGLSDVRGSTGGVAHTCALLNAGGVACWGAGN
jgi:hypothetical protein